jgi:PKD repeat protein
MFMKKMNRLLLAIGLCFLWTAAQAQPSKGGTPPSFKSSYAAAGGMATQSASPAKVLTAPDVAALKSEDVIDQANGKPPRVASILPVNFTMENSGEWKTLETGERIWQLTIQSPGALALSLYYDRFYLPKGAQLFIYSANKKHVLGAYTHDNNPLYGPEFTTEMVAGDELLLEYVAPPGQSAAPLSRARLVEGKNGEFLPVLAQKKSGETGEDVPVISIEGVAYVYNEKLITVSEVFYETNDGPVRAPGDEGSSVSCEVNINCSEGTNWQNQKKGVAATVQRVGGYSYICTGTLVNNTAQDMIPYFLMAFHCGEGATVSNLNMWQFYFHFERTDCSNASPRASYKTLVGAQRLIELSISGASDGLLLRLNDVIPQDWDVYYNGWDNRNTAATSGVGIHHPEGDLKKISTYTSPAISTTWNSNVGASNAHWRVQWAATTNGHGIVESGSSGSPLFNQNGLVIGTLSGSPDPPAGYTECTMPQDYKHALYGKFFWHWDQSSDATKHMKRYLDPINSGASTLSGRYVGDTVIANFSIAQTDIYASQPVTFIDRSYNATSYEWTFEGGSPATSSEVNPVITWMQPGAYNARLSVNGGEASKSVTVNVTLKGEPGIITAGTGTQTSTYPLGVANDYRYSRSAALYKPADLNNRASTIKTLAWYCGTNRTKAREVKIYLKHTPSAALTATSFNSLVSGATLVYSNNFFATNGASAWNTITLDTPFFYNGTGNLLVLVEVNGDANGSGSTSASMASTFRSSTVTNSALQWQSNSASGSPSGAGTVTNNRPNLQLEVEYAPNAPVADFDGPLAGNPIFSEGFDDTAFPPDGWNITSTNATAQWKVSNPSENPFSTIDVDSKFSALCAWVAQNHDEWLISPAFDVSEGLRISFYAGYSGEWLAGAHLESLISVEGGAYSVIWTTGSTSNARPWAWEKIDIDLAPYVGKSVKIGWRYVGNDGDLVGLDGVQIYTVDSAGRYAIYEEEILQLTDKSTGPPVTWEWSNPGGTPAETTDVTGIPPMVQYPLAGIYDIGLTVTNTEGSDTKYRENQLIVKARKPIPNFEAIGGGYKNINYGRYIPPTFTADFKDKTLANPLTYAWSFSGGSPAVSSDKHPTGIRYNTAGIYDVFLTVANSAGGVSVVARDLINASYTPDTICNLLDDDKFDVIPLQDNGTAYNGYLSGTNGLGVQRIAERYNAPPVPGLIKKVTFYVAASAGTRTHTVKIYKENANGLPGDVIYTHTNFTPTQLGTGAGLKTLSLTTPVAVNGPFFVSLEGFGATSETYSSAQGLILYQTEDRGAEGDGSFYVYFSNAWYIVNDLFDDGMHASLCIFPEFTYTQLAPEELTVTVPRTAGSRDLTVATNLSSYTISNTPNWFTVTQGTGKVTINYQTNGTTNLRSGTFSLSGGGVVKTITVRQLPGDELKLEVAPATLNVPATAGSVTVALTATVAWTAETDALWLAYTTSGTGDVPAYAVNYEANPSTDTRTTTLTFRGSGQTAVLTLNQAAAAPYLTADPATLLVPKNEGSQIIAVSSNVAWTAVSSDSWLTLMNNSGEGNDNLYIAYPLNTALQRSATITLTGGTLSQQVVVTQLGLLEVSATIDPIGTGTVTGAGIYARNDAVTLVARPVIGYIFDHWSIDGSSVGTSATYSFTVTESVNVTAHFVQPDIQPIQNLQGNYSVATNQTTLTWDAPPPGGAPVTDFAVYVANQRVATVPNTVFSYVYPNQAEGDVEYCVTSVIENGTESDAVCTTVRRLRVQTITWGQNLNNLTSSPVPLTAVASSGLPVSYTSSAPAVARVEGNQLILLNTGTAIITASQAGNADYLPAANVTKNVTITKIDQSITWDQTLGDLPYSLTPITLTAVANSGLPVAYTSSDESVALIEGNQLYIRGIGQALITASQAGDVEYNPAPSVYKTLRISNSSFVATGFLINNGAYVTSNRVVNLSYTYTGTGVPTEYIVSERADLSDALWKRYDPRSLTYTLATNDNGERTLYTRLRNNVCESSVLSAQILYKAAPPKLTLDYFAINGGSDRTNNRSVTLNHTVANGTPAVYSVAEDPALLGLDWKPYTALPVYELSGGVGLKEIYFVVADEAGESSNVASGQIYLDESVTVEAHGLTAQLFPNPVEDILKVIVGNGVAPVTVTVYSITGTVYLSQVYHSSTFDIDLSRCQAGTLLVRLSSGKNYTVKRIIKL